MENIAAELWENEIEFLNDSDPETEELLKSMQIALKEFEDSLNPHQQMLFDKYYKYMSELNAINEKKAFIKGYIMKKG